MRFRSVISRLIFSRKVNFTVFITKKHLPALASHLLTILGDLDQFAVPVAFVHEHRVDPLHHGLLGPQQFVNVVAACLLGSPPVNFLRA